jgi:hypothetical protein
MLVTIMEDLATDTTPMLIIRWEHYPHRKYTACRAFLVFLFLLHFVVFGVRRGASLRNLICQA